MSSALGNWLVALTWGVEVTVFGTADEPVKGRDRVKRDSTGRFWRKEVLVLATRRSRDGEVAIGYNHSSTEIWRILRGLVRSFPRRIPESRHGID